MTEDNGYRKVTKRMIVLGLGSLAGVTATFMVVWGGLNGVTELWTSGAAMISVVLGGVIGHYLTD